MRSPRASIGHRESPEVLHRLALAAQKEAGARTLEEDSDARKHQVAAAQDEDVIGGLPRLRGTRSGPVMGSRLYPGADDGSRQTARRNPPLKEKPGPSRSRASGPLSGADVARRRASASADVCSFVCQFGGQKLPKTRIRDLRHPYGHPGSFLRRGRREFAFRARILSAEANQRRSVP
jgi:hypothetical protein